MPLIYVTGNAGVGKTTVCEKLKARGYEAYDDTEPGLSAWYEKISGEQVAPPQNPEERTKEWYGRHMFKLLRPGLGQLAEKANDRSVFIFSQTFYDDEVRDLFSKVFCMTLDDKLLRERLATRTSNNFGKVPDELENILSWQKVIEEANRQKGAQMIDASQPLESIVEEITRSI